MVMESEAEIAARLRDNIPQEPAVTEQPTAQSVDKSDKPETVVVPALDELALYKLHKFFGENYSPYERENVKQVKYVYEAVAQRIGDANYEQVIATSKALLQMIGAAHSERKLYDLYQWLRLDETRRNVEQQMGVVHG